jgi:hypothetical protein
VRHRFTFPSELSRTALVDSFLRPINDFLEVRSHLYLFFRTRLHTVRMRLGLAPLTFPPAFLKARASVDDWALTAEVLSDLDSLASEHGSRALFVLMPAPFQVDSVSLNRYVSGFALDPDGIDLEQPNERLGRELSARGLLMVDPLAAFRAGHEEGERLYGAVDPHLSAAGHRLLADIVAPIAAELMANPSDNAAPDGS